MREIPILTEEAAKNKRNKSAAATPSTVREARTNETFPKAGKALQLTPKPHFRRSLMLTLFGALLMNLFKLFLTIRKRKESELNDPPLKALESSSLALVGKSTGAKLGGILENQSEIRYLCKVPQARPTKTAIASACEPPLVIADRQLLLPI